MCKKITRLLKVFHGLLLVSLGVCHHQKFHLLSWLLEFDFFPNSLKDLEFFEAGHLPLDLLSLLQLIQLTDIEALSIFMEGAFCFEPETSCHQEASDAMKFLPIVLHLGLGLWHNRQIWKRDLPDT